MNINAEPSWKLVVHIQMEFFWRDWLRFAFDASFLIVSRIKLEEKI